MAGDDGVNTSLTSNIFCLVMLPFLIPFLYFQYLFVLEDLLLPPVILQTHHLLKTGAAFTTLRDDPPQSTQTADTRTSGPVAQ
jgi:hypothetical protein